MMRNFTLEELIKEHQSGERIKYLFFWGHTPAKDQKVGPFCFSQWFSSPFIVDGVTYPTAEHWMMAGKARLFGDTEIASRILSSGNPGEVKKLGRQIRGFDEDTWVAHRFEIVVEGNYHKFSQSSDLKEYLLDTNDRVLVEASPVDNIWGIGIAKNSPVIEDPTQWLGLNLLGFALMEVRKRLKLEKYCEFNAERNSAILYRPVGPNELALIRESGWTAYPPRLEQQPIFYPVLNRPYAEQIARDWNVNASGAGYVTRFEIPVHHLMKFE
ncbi:MAG TPA: NADAR family protein, partial [Bacteroidales bacterium]|nr:NADAR family protein [Bacteroidales bacterium]